MAAGDAIMLAEANVPPDESLEYFGDEGDRPADDAELPGQPAPVLRARHRRHRSAGRALEATYERPQAASGCSFLRSHDELDLGRLTDEQRQKVFAAFGPTKDMQLYDRGIRRRLAPMLDNDRRRLELAFSLLFSLPGTPMMQYGDEIGIGDDLTLPERERADADAVVGRSRTAASRRRPPGAAGHQRPIYGYKRQRRSTAPRPAVAAQLDRADDPRAQGVSGDQLGGGWPVLGGALGGVVVGR